MARPVALALFAHPDDETLACGGTLAALADDAWDVAVVYVGDGLVSTRPDRADNRDDAAAACKVLGAREPVFLGFPDQRLDTVSVSDMVNAALEHARAAEVIFTNSSADLNRDHQIVSHVARVLARPVDRSVALVECEVPGGASWNGVAVAPNWYSDITETLARKLDALACYVGEARPSPHPRSLDAVEALARVQGAASGLGLAEGLTLVRGARGRLP